MQREQLADLAVFVAVAQERRFTRAAAKLGITQSSPSHTIRRLESHLGARLLARTTRSVAPTDAGERLLRTLSPAFEEIDAELASLSELRTRSSKVYPLASRLDAPCIQNWERLTPCCRFSFEAAFAVRILCGQEC